ncbi:hypothetical protein MRX96_044692 [Rhipicephalus microplus]
MVLFNSTFHAPTELLCFEAHLTGSTTSILAHKLAKGHELRERPSCYRPAALARSASWLRPSYAPTERACEQAILVNTEATARPLTQELIFRAGEQ